MKTTPYDGRPLITCVMSTYGRPDFLAEAVGLFLAQDYSNKELLVLNDCPRQVFTCESDSVRVINAGERYRSLGQKRNAAISQARGEWIAIWDDDDIYLPWHLSQAMSESKKHGTSFYRPETFWAYWGDEELQKNTVLPGWNNHAVTVFDKSLWQRVGGYPAMDVGEDQVFFDRIHRLLGESFIKYPIAEKDRSFILRGKSQYRHSSMRGGEQPLDTSPGVYYIDPRPIADDRLRAAYERLIAEHQQKPSQAQSICTRITAKQTPTLPARPSPKLSICITIKNRSLLHDSRRSREVFPRCVRALAAAAESIGAVELVVVDYDSTDQPLAEWLHETALPLQVQLIQVPGDFSRGEGLNTAVRAARSDYLFICDADILVDQDALQHGMAILDRGEAWFPVCRYLDEHDEPAYWQDSGYGLAFLHRKVFDAVGGIPEFRSWGGEDDLFYRRVKSAVPAIRSREPGLRHLWHDEDSRHRHYARPRKADYAEVVSQDSGSGFSSEGARAKARQAAIDFYKCFAGRGAASAGSKQTAASPPVFPAYGTLLGMLRDGDVIAHDSDVDFGCLSWPDGLPSESGQRLAPFKLSHLFHYKRKACELAFHHDNGTKVDLFLFEAVRGWRRAAAFPDEFPDRETMLEHFSQELFSCWTEISCWGEAFRVPDPPKKLMSAMYGAGWERPNPNWSFWGRNRSISIGDVLQLPVQPDGRVSVHRLFETDRVRPAPVLENGPVSTGHRMLQPNDDTRPLIRVAFDSFWPGFDLDRFRAYFAFLNAHYQFELSDHPDVVFHSVFDSGRDTRSRWPLAVRVFYTGENRKPPLQDYDYCLSFYRDVDHPRHLRLPIYVPHLYTLGLSMEALRQRPADLLAVNKRPKFCAFIASNPNGDVRNRFVEALGQYKAVDCPGPVLNNMDPAVVGDPHDSMRKIESLKSYRYAVCFENAATQGNGGYVTEKIADAMLAGCIPLYWGDHRVAEDFNPASFIDLSPFGDDVDAMVEHLIAMDSDPVALRALSDQPWLNSNCVPRGIDEEALVDFFGHVFEEAVRRRFGVVSGPTWEEDVAAARRLSIVPDEIVAQRRDICSSCSQAEGVHPDIVECAAAQQKLHFAYDRCRLRKWAFDLPTEDVTP